MDNVVLPEITTNTIKKAVEKDGAVLLEIEISIPKVVGGLPKKLERINGHYDEVAKRLLRYAESSLSRRALKAYYDFFAENGGFSPYRLEAGYEVIRNSAGILSLYRDVSEILPGEEAITARHVDNWNISSWTPVFPILLRKRRKALIKALQAQAKKRVEAGEVFYGEVKRNIGKHFNIANCAPTEKGMAVYYPPYSLAPYGKGFLKFEVEGVFPFE